MESAGTLLTGKMRSYFAEIGRRGGQASRRELTPRQAKRMVAIREAKSAAKAKRARAPKSSRKR